MNGWIDEWMDEQQVPRFAMLCTQSGNAKLRVNLCPQGVQSGKEIIIIIG